MTQPNRPRQQFQTGAKVFPPNGRPATVKQAVWSDGEWAYDVLQLIGGGILFNQILRFAEHELTEAGR